MELRLCTVAELFYWPAHNTAARISLHDLPYLRTILRCLHQVSPNSVILLLLLWLFPFFEVLLTCRTSFLVTSDQVWWLLEFSQVAPRTTYILWKFSYSIVNFVNPVHESDTLRSTSTFQKSSIRHSSKTSKFVCSSGHINIIQHIELNSMFNVMTINEIPFD